jgi:lambda repressor-like predicted transcriptional regulator
MWLITIAAFAKPIICLAHFNCSPPRIWIDRFDDRRTADDVRTRQPD